MTNNTEQVRSPESITIGGVTYQVGETPELQAFIQAVAKVEKSKLYSQMEAIREQVKTLQGVQVEQQPAFSKEELIEAMKGVFVTADSLKEAVTGCVKEVVQPVLDATQRTAQNEIEEYRKRLISENAATCIPELVKGNTKEELDAALAESIRLRQAYPSPVAQPVQEQIPANGQRLTPTPQAPAAAPQIPAAPRREAPAADANIPSAKQMSMTEFASKREALHQQLEQMYGSGSL